MRQHRLTSVGYSTARRSQRPFALELRKWSPEPPLIAIRRLAMSVLSLSGCLQRPGVIPLCQSILKGRFVPLFRRRE